MQFKVSKALFGPLAQHEVVIEGASGEKIQQVEGAELGDEYDDKKGKVDFFFTVKKAGITGFLLKAQIDSYS